MKLPTGRDWVFSVKTFIAAMLALYLALRLELPRPYWAMASVYVVSSPFVGATRSKALYRALGTLAGAAAAIFLVPLFVQAPYMMCLAIALWTGTLLYVSMLDRSARSYAFMLAGYTLPLVAFPTLGSPDTVFDVAVARSEEIILGIVCAAVVTGLIFPNRLGPALAERLGSWFRDAVFYSGEILAGRPGGKAMSACRQRMAATVNGFELLLSQLAYDDASPEVLRLSAELRKRMATLLPIASGLTDPILALRQEVSPASQQLASLLDQIAEWLGTPLDPSAQATGAQLQARLMALEPTPEALTNWGGALLSTTVWRLRQFLDLWQDCRSLEYRIGAAPAATPQPAWQPRFQHWRMGGTQRHIDLGMLLFSTASASGATFVVALLWIGLGWQDGAAGATLAAVACCFFASMDEPAPQVFAFFIWTCVAVVLSGLYLFVVLPTVHDFAMLVVMFAVPFICIGTLIPRPQFTLATMLTAVNTATFISIQSAYSADFGSFINNNLSGVVGLLFAFVWTRVTRPFGAEMAVRRLTRSSWQDGVLVSSRLPGDREQRGITARMVDRLLQLVPRLAASDDAAHPAIDSFRDLRISLSALDLQAEREPAAADLREAIDAVLSGVRRFFSDSLKSGRRATAGDALLSHLDLALQRASREVRGRSSREAVHVLVAMRVALFPRILDASIKSEPPLEGSAGSPIGAAP